MANRDRLSEEQIESKLAGVQGWARQGDSIVRTVKAPSFMDGIAFVGRVAELAEARDHHPDIDIRYTNITLTLSTHDRGGLTELDFELAGAIDAVD